MNIPFRFPSRGRARLALAGGFGGLLILLLLLGAYAARSLGGVRARGSQTSKAYLLQHDRLEAVRATAYLATGFVRNYLIDPNPDAIANHRQAARQEWAEMRRRLAAYRDVAPPGRKSLIAALESDLDSYWKLASAGLELTGAERVESAFTLLRDQLGPRREQFLGALDTIRNEDLADLRASIDQSVNILDEVGERLWMVIAICVLLGGALAAISAHYIGRFENEAATRYAESLDSAGRLEQLSHRLLAVQEEERRNLARELHDEVGQWLGAILMELGLIRKSLVPSVDGVAPASDAAERVRSAVDLTERTLRSVRDIGLLLRPSMLDDLGLIPALHWQARETSRRAGIRVEVETEDDDLALSDEVRTTVYRVVQEALQNAVRHAEARQVEVALLCRNERLRILVKDDGKGFDPAISRGLGILGMQERVIRLNGEFRIHSAPGHGTVLTFDLPAAGATSQREA